MSKNKNYEELGGSSLNTLPLNAFKTDNRTRHDDEYNRIIEKLDSGEGIEHNQVVEVTLPMGMNFEIYFVGGMRNGCGALYITHNKIMAATIAVSMDFARVEAYQYDADTMLGREKAIPDAK